MKRHFVAAIGTVTLSLFLLHSSIAAVAAALVPHHYSKLPIVTASMEEDILQLVNKHRADKGLAPLTTNAILTTEAEKHSQNMSNRKVPFGHKGFSDRMKRITSQVTNVREAGENVAHGDMTAEEVVKEWLNSPDHKKNIEGSNFRLTGIGIAKDKKGGYYFTQIFAG